MQKRKKLGSLYIGNKYKGKSEKTKGKSVGCRNKIGKEGNSELKIDEQIIDDFTNKKDIQVTIGVKVLAGNGR